MVMPTSSGSRVVQQHSARRDIATAETFDAILNVAAASCLRPPRQRRGAGCTSSC